jgi:LemA protein
MALQEEIERLEGMLADRRELYNDQVYRLNARIAQVPAVLLARLFGWEPRSFFDADPDAATPPPSLADAIGGPPAS